MLARTKIFSWIRMKNITARIKIMWHSKCSLNSKTFYFSLMGRYMKSALSKRQLRQENQRYLGTGGRSQENSGYGFRPAFLDGESNTIYLACYASGEPASCHIMDGLPAVLVIARSPTGHVLAVKNTVIAGFERDGRFYTREEAAREVMQDVSIAA